jgi:guanylate kinase
LSEPASNAPGRLVVVAAPSGAGKTSLTRALIERLAARGIRGDFSVSYTTRAARAGEREGVDYHFVTPETFAGMVANDAFLEHAEVFGRRYGTGREVTERLLAEGRLVFLDIDWQGARQVRTQFPQALHVFIQPPSLAELERRLRQRGQDDEGTIQRRMLAAQDEMSHASEFDHVLINDEFEQTVGRLEALVAPPA